jgi:hypothetical protein
MEVSGFGCHPPLVSLVDATNPWLWKRPRSEADTARPATQFWMQDPELPLNWCRSLSFAPWAVYLSASTSMTPEPPTKTPRPLIGRQPSRDSFSCVERTRSSFRIITRFLSSGCRLRRQGRVSFLTPQLDLELPELSPGVCLWRETYGLPTWSNGNDSDMEKQ